MRATSRNTARRTRWCASSPRRSISSDRCSAVSAAPKCRCPAAASSARARPTCTSKRSSRSAATCAARTAILIAESKRQALHGATIEFRTPSVGATKNAMLAAVLAEGTTTIKNVAMEPEVVDLGNFLVAMGAKIKGLGGRYAYDRRRERTARRRVRDHSRSHRDRHAAARRRGHARRRHRHGLPSRASRSASCSSCKSAASIVTSGDDWIRVDGSGITGGTDILTAPYPGFPTDLQPQMLSFLAPRPGHERRRRVDFQRALLVRERTRAHGRRRARLDGEQHGGRQRRGALSGAPVEAPDIRAGAALVIAGLAAAGETEIIGLEYIDRGYERLEEMLSALGRPSAAQQRRHAASRTGGNF